MIFRVSTCDGVTREMSSGNVLLVDVQMDEKMGADAVVELADEFGAEFVRAELDKRFGAREDA